MKCLRLTHCMYCLLPLDISKDCKFCKFQEQLNTIKYKLIGGKYESRDYKCNG